jgi:hypothetical protein
MQGTNGSTVFTDSSTYGHSVTAAGNAQINNNKLLLTGEGGYLITEESEDLELGTAAFRIEADIAYEPNDAEYMTIFCYKFDTDASSLPYLRLSISFGVDFITEEPYFVWELVYGFSGEGFATLTWGQSDALILSGVEVSIALVRDENGISLELDGERLETDFGEGEYYTFVDPDFAGNQVIIGGHDSIYGFEEGLSFSGTIDNFDIMKPLPED